MADTPKDAPALTDDDFVGLVDEVESEFASGSDPAPATAPRAPSGEEPDDKRPGAAGADNAAGGGNDEDEPKRQPEGDAAAEVVDPAAAASAPPAAIPPGSKPFTYQATKGTHTLPGAHELPDGSVLIAKDALPDFRRTLASEAELRTNFVQFRRDTQRKLQAVETARVKREEEAEAVYKLFGEIRKMSPEQRWDYFQKFDEELPQIELSIERKKIDNDRAELERAKAGPELTEEEQQEQVQQFAAAELNTTFKTLEQHPDAKLFTRDELIDLYKKWAKRPQRLTRVAEQDGDGFKKGQVLFDDTDVFEDFQLLVGIKRRAAQAAGGSGAAARNAALNADQDGKNKIPPVVPPARPAGPGTPRERTFKGDRKGFKNAFLAGDLDDKE